MITDKSGWDIIIIGQQPWDTEIGSNCKDIALEMSKRNRVLYVNSPLDRVTRIRNRKDPKIKKRIAIIEGQENGLIKVNENLWNLYPDCMVESINWISNRFIFDAINKRNNRKFAESIKKALKKIGFFNYILFNDNEMFTGFYLKEFLKPECSIYYSRDYMLAVDYWKKHGERIEPLLIAKSDICMSNSTYLADYCRKYNPDSFYIGQGCDLELFENVKDTAAELKSIKGPIVGYVGALQSIRLDIDLIEKIACARPDWHIVLVGPEDEKFRSSILHERSNVIFLGLKPVSQVPSYINAFDVCINPQLVNEVTIGNYPRKIDEYLAMGKPVVATTTRAMEIFKEYVYLAGDAAEYIKLIEQALKEDTPLLHTERKEFAGLHTWENCVHEIYSIITATSHHGWSSKVVNTQTVKDTSLI
jgi:teichuronic acid biosynthesis glycosyltransferase TuaH